jgi:spore coat protein U-like protein
MRRHPASAAGRVGPRAAWWLVAAALAVTVVGSASKAAAQCRVRVNTTVAFGTYNVFSGTPRDAQGQIAWRCNLGWRIPVQITISRGNYYDGTWRRMKISTTAAEYLQYNLYRDTARTNVWGDGTFGSSYTATSSGLPTWVTLYVYGRMPISQDAAIGTYSDSTLVIINF